MNINEDMPLTATANRSADNPVVKFR